MTEEVVDAEVEVAAEVEVEVGIEDEKVVEEEEECPDTDALLLLLEGRTSSMRLTRCERWALDENTYSIVCALTMCLVCFLVMAMVFFWASMSGLHAV